eukprot:jgi/Chlat1/8021/Chrsp7S00632
MVSAYICTLPLAVNKTSGHCTGVSRARPRLSTQRAVTSTRVTRVTNVATTSDATIKVGEGAEGRKGLFDSIAPMYDVLNDALSLGQHRVWKRMAVKWAGARQGQSVLDVCCGSGDVVLRLAETVGPAGSVTGLDFARAQLEVAAKRHATSYPACNVPVKFIEGDALNLPFEDNSFDAATISYGLRNVVDIPKCLRELHRVLKPGSRVAILDFNNSTDALASSAQGWMLDNVVVPVAKSFGVGPQYEYLRPSIEVYPTGPELETLAVEAGFARAMFYEIAAGLMGCLVASKQ